MAFKKIAEVGIIGFPKVADKYNSKKRLLSQSHLHRFINFVFPSSCCLKVSYAPG